MVAHFFFEAGLALGFAAGFPVFVWTSGRNAVVRPPIVSKWMRPIGDAIEPVWKKSEIGDPENYIVRGPS
mgnify:CR=1 FL=1